MSNSKSVNFNLKKELYKITAYHCPACGGITKPEKNYCEYCGRKLILHGNKGIMIPKARILIECDNYIYFDEISRIEVEEKYQYGDCYRDANETLHRATPFKNTIYSLEMPITKRTEELLRTSYTGSHKTRIEWLNGRQDLAFECEGYICQQITDFEVDVIATTRFKVIDFGDTEIFDTAIPQKIVEQMRCPNCGAEIKSRFGACDYCSGWSEVEW